MTKEIVYLDAIDQSSRVLHTHPKMLTVYTDRLGRYIKHNGRRYLDVQNHFRSPPPIAIPFHTVSL
jgi:hypothetical protein